VIRLRRLRAARRALLLLSLASFACGGGERGGELHVRKVVLEREVKALRQQVADLETGKSVLPPSDMAIAIDDTLVKDLVAAQLPFALEVKRFKIELTDADVLFRGSPMVRLHGAISLKNAPSVGGEVEVLGALEDLQIDTATDTLRAAVGVGHIDIRRAAGLESLLSGSTLDELSRTVRLQLDGKLPPIQIPVKVQQSIVLPAVTDGPVRIEGASMPLQVAISRVFAGQNRLWIGLSVQPGDFVKTKDATPRPSGSPEATASPGGSAAK